mmetsp:Transcript_26010/g.85521  ORF Transcript_26010/g.85521 Transcript_26010/m.85521 type:complete len:401 (-) Transcript_26010:344-1546(-)
MTMRDRCMVFFSRVGFCPDTRQQAMRLSSLSTNASSSATWSSMTLPPCNALERAPLPRSSPRTVFRSSSTRSWPCSSAATFAPNARSSSAFAAECSIIRACMSAPRLLLSSSFPLLSPAACNPSSSDVVIDGTRLLSGLLSSHVTSERARHWRSAMTVASENSGMLSSSCSAPTEAESQNCGGRDSMSSFASVGNDDTTSAKASRGRMCSSANVTAITDALAALRRITSERSPKYSPSHKVGFSVTAPVLLAVDAASFGLEGADRPLAPSPEPVPPSEMRIDGMPPIHPELLSRRDRSKLVRRCLISTLSRRCRSATARLTLERDPRRCTSTTSSRRELRRRRRPPPAPAPAIGVPGSSSASSSFISSTSTTPRLMRKRPRDASPPWMAISPGKNISVDM